MSAQLSVTSPVAHPAMSAHKAHGVRGLRFSAANFLASIASDWGVIMAAQFTPEQVVGY